jgi:hypothetical protein
LKNFSRRYSSFAREESCATNSIEGSKRLFPCSLTDFSYALELLQTHRWARAAEKGGGYST